MASVWPKNCVFGRVCMICINTKTMSPLSFWASVEADVTHKKVASTFAFDLLISVLSNIAILGRTRFFQQRQSHWVCLTVTAGVFI